MYNVIYHFSLLLQKLTIKVEACIESINSTLESGEDVLISGSGKFYVNEKGQRRGRNPANREDNNQKSSIACYRSWSKVGELYLSLTKMNVDAVIFDLDGTILDSIGIYYQIIETVFQHLGLKQSKQMSLVNQ